MKDIKFSSLNELYNRVLPALDTRISELNIKGIKYLKSEDIWHFLKDTKWSEKNNLLLSEMVDDILNTDLGDIDTYLRKNKDNNNLL